MQVGASPSALAAVVSGAIGQVPCRGSHMGIWMEYVLRIGSLQVLAQGLLLLEELAEATPGSAS